MTGWATKPRVGRDPCLPTLVRGQCMRCARYRPWLPADTDLRQTVVIDGTFAVLNDSCCLFTPFIDNEPAPVRIVEASNLEFAQ